MGSRGAKLSAVKYRDYFTVSSVVYPPASVNVLLVILYNRLYICKV